MTAIIEQTRLLWQCRRGMLELDLLLIPFAEKQYPHLSDNEKQAFNALLHYPDPVLFDWMMGAGNPNEPELIDIVQLIRTYHCPPSF